MPDLSSRNVPVVKYLIPQLMVGLIENDQLGLYLREFIRLTDKAIFEYEDARLAFEVCNEIDRTILPHIVFTNHFETCLNAIVRLLKLMDRIKRIHKSDDRTRAVRRMAEAYGRDIPDIRNEIEHMANAIQNGCIASGRPVMLMLSDDGREVIVGNYQIGITQVANELKGLHRFALAILQANSQSTLPETK